MPRPTNTPPAPSIAPQRHRSASSLVRQLPLAVQLPPVQLPVSGRTLGRHVSLGPGWEQNKEGAAQQYSNEPSTSQAAAEAASPPEVGGFVLRLEGRMVMSSPLCSRGWQCTGWLECKLPRVRALSRHTNAAICMLQPILLLPAYPPSSSGCPVRCCRAGAPTVPGARCAGAVALPRCGRIVRQICAAGEPLHRRRARAVVGVGLPWAGVCAGSETDSRARGRLRVCRQVGAQHSVSGAAPQPCGVEPACFAACSALCCAENALGMPAAYASRCGPALPPPACRTRCCGERAACRRTLRCSLATSIAWGTAGGATLPRVSVNTRSGCIVFHD